MMCRVLRRSKAQQSRGWLVAIEGGAEVAAATLAAPFLRRSYNRWGATSAEVAAAMPRILGAWITGEEHAAVRARPWACKGTLA
jgi:hypothetical protein